ncbi:hypothetical protein AYR56_10135 [Loigolactobacillus backii]|uniref:Polysaccharide polymerase n=1 Tax=Loigolactobacillus backii TaxID=375175 RepID=A0A192H2K3_9LACO|nr:hypothetical protein [Loigolactobacillus backii]ANK62508.1 hypothetical protein AYR53_06855 [Loigolactobacillus backii]ANK70480.1 hypothetical protein AYR56_10135 [Loigolactobacillus backii]
MYKNNDSTNRELKTKFLQIILGIIVFYQFFIGSYWSTINTSSVWKYVSYFLYALLALVWFFFFLRSKFSLKQLIFVCILLSLAIFFAFKQSSNVAVIFLVGLYSLNLNLRRLVSTYLYASLAAICFIATLSIFGVLPKVVNVLGINYMTLGFTNPNNTGMLLVTICLLTLTLEWEKRMPFFSILESLFVGFFILKELQDSTAIIMLIGMFMLWLVSRSPINFYNWKIVRFVCTMLPIELTLIAFWIGNNFGKYYILNKLDSVFTSRPSIWHYYLNLYPLKLLGNQLQQVISMGYNTTVGNGAFDGAYIVFPIMYGTLAFAIVLFILSFAMRTLLQIKDIALISLFIILLFSGFSENSLMYAFATPILPISFVLCSPDWRHENIVN